MCIDESADRTIICQRKLYYIVKEWLEPGLRMKAILYDCKYNINNLIVSSKHPSTCILSVCGGGVNAFFTAQLPGISLAFSRIVVLLSILVVQSVILELFLNWLAST